MVSWISLEKRNENGLKISLEACRMSKLSSFREIFSGQNTRNENKIVILQKIGNYAFDGVKR